MPLLNLTLMLPKGNATILTIAVDCINHLAPAFRCCNAWGQVGASIASCVHEKVWRRAIMAKGCVPKPRKLASAHGTHLASANERAEIP